MENKEFNYNENIGKSDKVSKNCLFVCHSIFQIISIFFSTFLIAHIYSFSGDIYDYIFKVCVFNLSSYGTMFILYFIAARIVDKTNRISLYRLSLIVQTLLVVIFIFYGQQISKILLLSGVIKGTSDALYYASYNVLKQEMVGKKNMGNYVSGIYVSSKIVDLTIPVILGVLIDVTTYSFVAIIVCVISLIQVGVSIFIKAQKPKGSNHNIKEFFKHLKENPKAAKQIRFIYIISMFYVSAIIARLLNICVMVQFKSALSLGVITSILGCVSVLTIFLVRKFTKAGHRNWLFTLSGVLLIVSSVLFLVDINKTTVILYDVVLTIGGIIFKINYDAYRNGVLKEAGLYDDIAEHHVIMETIYNILRLICFSIIFLIAIFKQFMLFKIYLIVVSCIYATAFILTGVYEKKFIRNKTDTNKTA